MGVAQWCYLLELFWILIVLVVVVLAETVLDIDSACSGATCWNCFGY